MCVLPLLFCLLGNTAELYFSPTMSLVSQTIPKMRPRFAGGEGGPVVILLFSHVLDAICAL